MKMKRYHLLLLCMLLFFSCSEKENDSCRVDFQLFSEEYPTLPFEEMKVILTNKEQGTSYTSNCNPDGIASFQVECGYYTASVHYQTSAGLIFSGRIESAPLLPQNNGATIKMELSRSTTNALVIKEIYYGGCMGRMGEEYQSDQYVTLYNNSDTPIYLDGLCIAVVDPASSLKSPWIEYTDMKRIPVSNIAWQFPGSGQEYPLAPGSETTIATNAVNHTGGEYQHPNSIDLSKVDWGFWDVSLKRQDITPGVKQMKLLSNLNPNLSMYAFPVIGPTLMVFDIQGTSAEEYVSNPDNHENKPQSANLNKYYLMIPKEWVIDCVECVESASQTTNKRVPNDLDNGAAFISDGLYKGKVLVRKKAGTEEGHIVYQDTNNSTDDMITSTPALKK